VFTACGIKRNYCPKHVALIEIINKIVIGASSWLFILLSLQQFGVFNGGTMCSV